MEINAEGRKKEEKGEKPLAGPFSGLLSPLFPFFFGLAGQQARTAEGVKQRSGTKMVSGLTYLPRQIAESGPFADQLDAQQHAKQPDRGYRKSGPKIKSYQYRKDAAR